jgi:hypothetical protein
MAKIKSKYYGAVTLPNGKILKFSIEGESETEVRRILRDSQPKAKVNFKRKGK